MNSFACKISLPKSSILQQMRALAILLLALPLMFFSDKQAYDVILVVGQSNTFSGKGFDPKVDVGSPLVKQLGRIGRHNMRMIPAVEPLENHTPMKGHIGFSLVFARAYAQTYLAPKRKVLLIPCGMGSTGFFGKYWNKGDTLYNDAVKRTKYVLGLNGNNKLVAILWQQGEADVARPGYQQRLDSMIVQMRRDIGGTQQIPFFLGGMVPAWTNADTARKRIQQVIARTPQRVPYTYFVNPYFPTVITTGNRGADLVHYDAPAQHVLGGRYFAIYDSLYKYH